MHVSLMALGALLAAVPVMAAPVATASMTLDVTLIDLLPGDSIDPQLRWTGALPLGQPLVEVWIAHRPGENYERHTFAGLPGSAMEGSFAGVSGRYDPSGMFEIIAKPETDYLYSAAVDFGSQTFVLGPQTAVEFRLRDIEFTGSGLGVYGSALGILASKDQPQDPEPVYTNLEIFEYPLPLQKHSFSLAVQGEPMVLNNSTGA